MSKKIACYICKEIISTGNFLQLGEKIYHPDHFCCFQCKKPLENEDFSEHNDQIYCEEHYLEATGAPKCSKCSEYISGEHCIIAGKPFHSECFKCDYCKRGFPNGEYYKSSKYYLCILCFSKFKAENCATCGKSIIDQVWTAMGKNYHYECLVCLKCGGTFDENGFITVDDNPFHEECIAVYCGFCEESIIDEYFEIDGESVHEKCVEQFQKSGKSQGNSSKINEKKEAERKKKLEKNLKEKEIKDQQRVDALLKMEEIMKRKDKEKEKSGQKNVGVDTRIKEKIEENIEISLKTETIQKKGPPNFATFMKNLKKKETIEEVTEKTTKTFESQKSEKNQVPITTKNQEIAEKPILSQGNNPIEKPRIPTIIQESPQKPQKTKEFYPTEEKEKIILSQTLSKPQENLKETNTHEPSNENRNKTETKTEKSSYKTVEIETKTEEEKESVREESSYNIESEKKTEEVKTVKIEKKFIKMHNKFKKI